MRRKENRVHNWKEFAIKYSIIIPYLFSFLIVVMIYSSLLLPFLNQFHFFQDIFSKYGKCSNLALIPLWIATVFLSEPLKQIWRKHFHCWYL